MTLEQKRAAKAFADVTALATRYPKETNDAERKSYGSLALKLPALLRTAGLCQALHFLDSRNKETAKTLLLHLAGQLHRVHSTIEASSSDSLLDKIREARLSDYLRLSREAIAVANWYSRLTRSILKIDPTEEGEEGK